MFLQIFKNLLLKVFIKSRKGRDLLDQLTSIYCKSLAVCLDIKISGFTYIKVQK